MGLGQRATDRVGSLESIEKRERQWNTAGFGLFMAFIDNAKNIEKYRLLLFGHFY